MVTKTGEEIHRILGENYVVFGIKTDDSTEWMNYKRFIDDLVSKAMLLAVGCGLVTNRKLDLLKF